MIQKTLVQGYVVDTSALIDMWRKHYAPDIFVTLWEKDLEEIIHQGLLVAPQEVYKELRQRDDDLFKWAKEHKTMFIDLNRDTEQIKYVKVILERYRELVDSKKTTPDADPFVIGLAKSKGWAVITSEKDKQGKIKIPGVCRELNVKCIGLLEFFREMKWAY